MKNENITIDELRKLLEADAVALFDVRGDVAYESGHIPGAKTAPLGSLTFRVADVLDPESPVVVYGESSESELAERAVERLQNLGLKNVSTLEAGLDGWRAADLPVVESPHATVAARGPAKDVRSLVVDRDSAYGGAFKGEPPEGGGAGG